jgi:hypothetical protein
MLVFFLLVFAAAIAVEVWAMIAVEFAPRANRWVNSSYWLFVFLAVSATVGMTGFFSYYPNPNAHVFGWPIARVVFQRNTAGSPWLDFVGPTLVLAYPMNFVLYMFVPSVIFLLVARRQKRDISKA